MEEFMEIVFFPQKLIALRDFTELLREFQLLIVDG